MRQKRLTAAVLAAVALLSTFSLWLYAGGSVVPVGSYLYANPTEPEQFPGRLTLHFKTPGKQRMVIAYGRKWRKDRKTREGTTEAEREPFKPWLGDLTQDGAEAVFENLPHDYYDIVVIDPARLKVHEGVSLVRNPDRAKATDAWFGEIKQSLGLREDRIGGWEAFFDTKAFNRFETDGVRAGVFLQQMRLGTALAESGDVLKGCIHSIDVVWVERAKVEGAGWQVVARQQLYRDEIPERELFEHHFVESLQGIRVGSRPKELSAIDLP